MCGGENTAESRRAPQTVYEIKYNVVWVKECCYKVLRGDLAERTRDSIRKICEQRDVWMIRGQMSSDHVKLFVSVPPQLSVSQLMHYVRGTTSRQLQQEYPDLEKWYWGRHLWAWGTSVHRRVPLSMR